MHHENDDKRQLANMEVFVQAEGKQQIKIVRLPEGGAVRDLIDEAIRAELVDPANRETVLVLLENSDDEVRPNTPLRSAGIGQRSRVHLHRCARVKVAVNFNGVAKKEVFRPSATIAAVFAWAAGPKGFGLTPTDAVEHVLQITGSAVRPDEDAHLGTLTSAPACSVEFDLVAKRRVEG